MRELQLSSEEIESYIQKLKDPEFFKACFPKAVYSRATKTANSAAVIATAGRKCRVTYGGGNIRPSAAWDQPLCF